MSACVCIHRLPGIRLNFRGYAAGAATRSSNAWETTWRPCLMCVANACWVKVRLQSIWCSAQQYPVEKRAGRVRMYGGGATYLVFETRPIRRRRFFGVSRLRNRPRALRGGDAERGHVWENDIETPNADGCRCRSLKPRSVLQFRNKCRTTL